MFGSPGPISGNPGNPGPISGNPGNLGPISRNLLVWYQKFWKYRKITLWAQISRNGPKFPDFQKWSQISGFPGPQISKIWPGTGLDQAGPGLSHLDQAGPGLSHLDPKYTCRHPCWVATKAADSPPKAKR